MTELPQMTFSNGRSTTYLFVAGILALVSQPAMAAERAKLVGGSGGRPFEVACGDGEILVGIVARAGAMVDAVAPVCGRAVNPEQIDPGSQYVPGQLVGGGGGQQITLDCPSGFPGIRNIAVQAERDGRNVDGLYLSCRKVDTTRNDRSGGQYDGMTQDERERAAPDGVMQAIYPPVSRCELGSIAVGIYGASDRWINRLGLLCGPPVTHNPSVTQDIRTLRGGRDGDIDDEAAEILNRRKGDQQSPATDLLKKRRGPGQ